MNSLALEPIGHPVRARVRLPGSKSLTNRALAIAALADGATTLTHALFSDDTQYFCESLTQLGFHVTSDPDSASISVTGFGGRIPARQADLYAGNAGTVARFLTAFVTLGDGDFRLDGNARMRQRPIADLISTLNQLGANVRSLDGVGCLPVLIAASGLPGGTAHVAGDTSSQFLSAVLLAAPYARSPVDLLVERGLNSKPYVDMTLSVMADFGIKVEREGYERFRVRPDLYRAQTNYVVESDASAASYFFAAPAILGGSVRVEELTRRSRQGDMAFLDVLAAMGCHIVEGDGWIEVAGPEQLRGVDVDLRDAPDTAQTLAAIAPFADTPTVIRGIASARFKETDRVAATCAELTRLGVPVREQPDGLIIEPCRNIRPAVVRTYDDHRMAMAFALIGLKVPGISIENPACVSKTFPRYFDVLEQLRKADE
jgi:3-phosphoshikimate 1-carboxyvinyltransferase